MTDPSTMEPPEFVQHLLREAATAACTDVYVLPGRETTVFRRRSLAGESTVADVPAPYGTQCVARIKVLAGMLTYRTSVAQDGAIHGIDGLPDVQFRVASMPTRTGERITIRILASDGQPRLLDELGFAESARERLARLLQHPTGLLILTGPTGSGKTTTIYALIRELLRAGHPSSTLITIEDPVESAVEGISQVQIRRGDPEWGYPPALRAALRHDVKTLVIGEMRDAGVVRVALDAALSGHRIITTYHAGDVAGVYARMLHQGFEPFLVASAVNGVVAQRLVPRPDDTGVVPVVAVLEADDAWREFIIGSPGLCELRRRAAQRDGVDLEAEARRLAAEGRIEEKDAYLL